MIADAPSLEVFHVGPSTGSAGGIGAVINTYVLHSKREDRIFRHHAITTYYPASLLRSVGALLRTSALFAAHRLRGRRFIVHVHLSQGGSFLREGVMAAAGRILGQVSVATVHGSGFLAFSTRHPFLVRLGLWGAEDVLCLTKATQGKLEELCGGKRVRLVGNPVDFRPLAPRTAHPEPVAFMAGELGTRKGVDVLLDAWVKVLKKIPDAKLRLAGPIHPSIRAKLIMSELTGIVLLGVLGPEDVLRELDNCVLAVLPSRAEALPKFLLEAMSRARAVVSTDVGAIADLVGTDCGRVVEAGNSDQLSDALVQLLSDVALADRLGKRGCDRVRNRFETGVHVQEIEAIYAGSLVASRAVK